MGGASWAGPQLLRAQGCVASGRRLPSLGLCVLVLERTGLVPLSALLPALTTSGVSSNFSACLQSWDLGPGPGISPLPVPVIDFS